jgi:hypothetical protein
MTPARLARVGLAVLTDVTDTFRGEASASMRSGGELSQSQRDLCKDDGIAELVSVERTALCNAVFGGEDARDCEEVTEDTLEWKRFLEFLGRPKSVCVQCGRAGLSLVESEGAAIPGLKAFIVRRSAQSAVDGRTDTQFWKSQFP